MPVMTRLHVLLGVCVSMLSLAHAAPLPLQATVSDGGETVVAFYEIEGTGDRQNPIRRTFASPFSGDTLFVRFRLRYEASSIDSAASGDGEFFVLWLDQVEGSGSSTHSGGIPNLGIHVDERGENRFMVRYQAKGEAFGPPLEGDRDTVLVARLAKSVSGDTEPFDELSLWVDPTPDSLAEPDAVVRDAKAISKVSWLGFSTARKTEPGDRILVGDLRTGTAWQDMLGKPAPAELMVIPDPPAFVPPPPPTDLVDVPPQPESLASQHWSFQPIRRPQLPAVPAGEIWQSWIQSPIDAFIAEKLASASLTPAPPADTATLARRIALVLTGLPSAPPDLVADVEGHTASREASIEQLIDACLTSAAYGERWGRHWLDVARWAESNGYQHNRIRDHAWRYRDWVVESFTDDKPFDDFLREQLAGDEIEPYADDHIVATGFLAAARYSGNELDKTIQRNDILVDVANTTAGAFLGLTMECAQCHDHFFDPITQWDYYQFMAFFAQGQPGDVILGDSQHAVADSSTIENSAADLVSQRWGLFESVRSRLIERKRAAGVAEPILVIPKNVPQGMTAAEKRAFTRIEADLAKLPKAWAFHSPVTSPHDLSFAPTAIRWPLPFQEEALEHASVRFLDRGDPASPGPEARPAWPLVFGTPLPDEVGPRPRLALAEWLVDPANPLTARVWVNRIWQWHFGRGLVESSGDFGTAGGEPSHPELLDWLACELIDSGWSTQHIHRLILSSRTFRQSSQFTPSHATRDPENRLLWRWLPRRLEAEAIRDSALAVAGMLDPAVGGPSVPAGEAATSGRRSLYLQQRRDALPHHQDLFDGANAITSCSHRRTSTVALQPLWMLNSTFMQQQAVALARLVERRTETVPSAERQAVVAEELIRVVLQREASPEEIGDLAALIRSGGTADAALVMLNTNEFVYIP